MNSPPLVILKGMDLPVPLRQLSDEVLGHLSLTQLSQAAETLSQRYRSETQDGTLHLSDDLAARAYIATRLPATYGAISASFAATAKLRPDFAPQTLLDVGAGPGTALWAAKECWRSLGEAFLVEASPSIRGWGEKASDKASLNVTWLSADATSSFAAQPADLVTIAYVLNELSAHKREALIHRLWSLTKDMLVIVEPGTPAGYKRILQARDQLIAAGAWLIAPCPHTDTCPLSKLNDWCHFSQRVTRSKLHRQAKGAEVGWEDEKYSYLAVSRHAGENVQARVLATPKGRSGLVTLKLCNEDGSARERTISKREGDMFKKARRVDWGETL
jgi:ribosomal protein RSM22 (predicted rRNA methylase)